MNAQEIAAQLAEFFPPEAIGWIPAAISKDKSRAMAAAYIDARDVMDRLDSVVGIGGWKDRYQALTSGSIICGLSVRIDDKWITKTDVGGQSDQKSIGDRDKSAFSDALKRAAVKFGIGRYLYSLPQRWYGWNEQKGEFAEQPVLPAWALPKNKTSEPAKKDNPNPKESPNGGQKDIPMPKTGAELLKMIVTTDKRLAVTKLILRGELLEYIRRQGIELGYSDDIAKWDTESQIKFGWNESREFLRRKRDHRITPAQEIEIRVMCQERSDQIEAQICDELAVKSLADIPDVHFQSIIMKLREIPVKPVTASTR